MKTLASRLRKNPGDPYWNNVSLLLNGEGANGGTTFPDLSKIGHSLTAYGNVQVSTATKKMNAGSISLDGTTDGFGIASHSSLHFGSGDFTAEWWFNANANSGVRVFFNTEQGSSTTHSYAFIMIGSAASFYLSSNGSSWNVASGVSIGSGLSTGTWYHMAVCRSGTSIRGFLNGALGGTATSSATLYDWTGTCAFGRYYNGNDSINGYLDDVRLTKGAARYTAAFTPPSRPHLLH